jgi:hypothetical protein
MKAILSLVAAAAVLGFAAPSTAKADHACGSGATRVVGYTSCGTPIIAVYRIVGYDHCGRPVGQWVTQTPRVGYNAPRPGYGFNPGFRGPQPGFNSCQPSYGRPRSGISFSFGFGR